MSKITKTRWLLATSISVGVLSLTGCMSTKTVPHGDMTMAQIYNQQTGLAVPMAETPDKPGVTQKTQPPQLSKKQQLAVAQSQALQIQALNATATDYTATAANQVDNQFKPLPNPGIAIYVFPHLSQFGDTRVPIPGYTTSFFLYEQNQYAMPSEIY